MYARCPGQDSQNLRAAIYRCPKCGADVEIFSDEVRVKCKKCGEYVYPKKLPSCIEWCAAARKCLGEEKWKQVMAAIAERPEIEREDRPEKK